MAMTTTTTATAINAPLLDDEFIIVYYQIVDAYTGDPYHGVETYALTMPPHEMLVQLRDAIRARNRVLLQHLAAGQLKVFASRHHLQRNMPLRASHVLSNLPTTTTTNDNPLYVAVPRTHRKMTDAT